MKYGLVFLLPMFLPNALIIAAVLVVGVERSMERNFAAPGVLEVVLLQRLEVPAREKTLW